MSNIIDEENIKNNHNNEPTFEEKEFLKFVDKYRANNGGRFVSIIEIFRLTKKFLSKNK